jgi:hypothetical protein
MPPRDDTVEPDTYQLTISGSRHGVPTRLVLKLTPTIHGGWGSGAPTELADMADPTNPTARNSYRRTRKEQDIVWASYSARDPISPNRIVGIPQDLEHATIRIPAMTINGTKYDSQDLIIVRKKYVGVIPVNC